ncbi:transposase [Lichenicoccus sp.]|uniref:transposase n=1 Tax=Lichenicoccus sp. TaxID=2781899 RepID=UPI003D0C93A0
MLDTIEGIGPQSAACIIAAVGDPARCKSAIAWPAISASSAASSNPASPPKPGLPSRQWGTCA